MANRLKTSLCLIFSELALTLEEHEEVPGLLPLAHADLHRLAAQLIVHLHRLQRRCGLLVLGALVTLR